MREGKEGLKGGKTRRKEENGKGSDEVESNMRNGTKGWLRKDMKENKEEKKEEKRREKELKNERRREKGEI